jgi:hypothetical protein
MAVGAHVTMLIPLTHHQPSQLLAHCFPSGTHCRHMVVYEQESKHTDTVYAYVKRVQIAAESTHASTIGAATARRRRRRRRSSSSSSRSH